MGRVNSTFKSIVDTENIPKIRRALLNIINGNPDMRDGDFSESLKYAELKIGKNRLYEPNSNRIKLTSDKAMWDENYMSRLSLALRKEFSEDVISHIQKVAPVAYKGKYDIKKSQMAEGHQLIKEKDQKIQIAKQQNTRELKTPIREQNPMVKRVQTQQKKSENQNLLVWIIVGVVIILGLFLLII